MSDKSTIDVHVGELLSGFIDGELTQQDSQRVQLHVDQCASCGRELEEIRSLRKKIGAARLSDIQHDTWRETMDDITVKTSRGIGWLMLIGGGLVAAGLGLIGFLTDDSLGLMEKLVIGSIYAGVLLIFLSVLRQRLIERKKDRYKDVEI